MNDTPRQTMAGNPGNNYHPTIGMAESHLSWKHEVVPERRPPGEGGVSIAWFKVVRHSAFRKDVDLPED